MTVWFLSIEHKHGSDTTIHASEAGARACLATYCREWWEEVAPEDADGEPMSPPEQDDDVIRAYFDGDDAHECFTLEALEVQP